MMPQPRHWGVFPCLNYYTLLCSLGIISHTLGCMRFLEYMGFVLAVFPLKYGFIIVQDSILGLHYLDIVHTESSWSNSITLHSTPSPPSPYPPPPPPKVIISWYIHISLLIHHKFLVRPVSLQNQKSLCTQ